MITHTYWYSESTVKINREELRRLLAATSDTDDAILRRVGTVTVLDDHDAPGFCLAVHVPTKQLLRYTVAFSSPYRPAAKDAEIIGTYEEGDVLLLHAPNGTPRQYSALPNAAYPFHKITPEQAHILVSVCLRENLPLPPIQGYQPSPEMPAACRQNADGFIAYMREAGIELSLRRVIDVVGADLQPASVIVTTGLRDAPGEASPNNGPHLIFTRHDVSLVGFDRYAQLNGNGRESCPKLDGTIALTANPEAGFADVRQRLQHLMAKVAAPRP